MALIHTCTRKSFSDAGPSLQVLSVGQHFAVTLLCLQKGQELAASEGDVAETIFSVISGKGTVLEGEARHEVEVGDVVHILLGQPKVLIAGDGTFAVLGVRHLRRRA